MPTAGTNCSETITTDEPQCRMKTRLLPPIQISVAVVNLLTGMFRRHSCIFLTDFLWLGDYRCADTVGPGNRNDA
jgi:hypothetical protein